MRWSLPAAPTLVSILTACVTVNVYFPAAAAQQAADRIIDSVTGQAAPAGSAEPGGAPAHPGAPGSSGSSGSSGPGSAAPDTAPNATRSPPQASLDVSRALLERLIDGIIPAAHAQGSANLDISTPQIRAITGSMRQRFSQLEPFFASGAIGMTADGMIAVRDPSAVPLAQRALVERLVADDNRDRSALYAEIARANGHPEWEPDIRRTFARRWVERGAQPGWYYQDASGGWRRK